MSFRRRVAMTCGSCVRARRNLLQKLLTERQTCMESSTGLTTSTPVKSILCWMQFMAGPRSLGYRARSRAEWARWRRRTRTSGLSFLPWTRGARLIGAKRFKMSFMEISGDTEIPDHLAVLKQLAATRPYMDMSRVGVFGGSFGGYFTIRAMLQAPEVFKVGVAAAPVTDFRQTSAFAEIWLGPPEHNQASYDFASNLRIARRISAGHLLLIHGTSDVNAPLSATVQMIEALIKAGKPYDLVLLPGQGRPSVNLPGI